MLRSFEPVVDKHCKVIILGTMPGVRSLEKQEYYGHERNSFWAIISNLFNKGPVVDYEEKKAMLLENHIALWDVLQACEREGSLDSNIKNPVPNDFKNLYIKYPNIKTIYFNGEPAEKLYKKLVIKKKGNIEIPYYRLPSTSPANAIRFELKLTYWNAILLSLKGIGSSKLESFTAYAGTEDGLSYEANVNFKARVAKHRTFDIGNLLKTEKAISLSENELIVFQHRLFEKSILSWKEKYSNVNQILKDTRWYVNLEFSDGHYKFGGNSGYPKNWCSFCENLQQLLREPF